MTLWLEVRRLQRFDAVDTSLLSRLRRAVQEPVSAPCEGAAVDGRALPADTGLGCRSQACGLAGDANGMQLRDDAA